MSDAREDLGYGPAPVSARELLAQHREVVDPIDLPTPTPYATSVICPSCSTRVGVTRHGTIEVHTRIVRVGAPASLCPGTAEPATSGRAA